MDWVAALLIEEAVMAVSDEADAKAGRDRNAWAAAQAAIAEARR